MKTLDAIVRSLDSFDREVRRTAVRELADAKRRVEWTPNARTDWMNLHAHTFHSYNSEGWSPSRLVFEAVQAGLEILGTVDFDVLDAMEEVFETGDLLEIKTVVGLETRVYVPEYSDRELNSPGEPGVAYFMAVGCFRLPESGSRGSETLARLKVLSENRNREMVDRINRHLGEVQLDYDAEVLPMTPSANPTERHLVEAYSRKGGEVFEGDPIRRLAFWADRFGMQTDDLAPVLGEEIRFQEVLRSKLMKKGGVGYSHPDPNSFPTLEETIDLALSMEALPAYAFLDGTTPGESDMRELLDFFSAKGVSALNIIPDRNWNLPDAADKRLKTQKLYEAVEAAREFSLPLCIGTEMNKKGLPFVDRFDAPELAPVVEDFRRGGRTIWGRTVLPRAQGKGWLSAFAKESFGGDRAKRFEFFEKIGSENDPGVETLERFAASSDFASVRS